MNAVSKIAKDDSRVEVLEEAPPLAPTAVAPVAEVVKPAPKKRRGRRFLLMAALPILLAVGGGYVWVTGGRYQDTENANLRQAKVSIASEVPGRIIKVTIADNQLVKGGDLMFEIDPQPYQIALSQADGSLAAARLNVEQLRAAYSQAVAQEQSAASELDFAKSQFDRAKDLVSKGINSQSSLDQARRDLQKTQQDEVAAQ